MTRPVNNVPHPSLRDPGRNLLGVSSHHLSSGCSWPVIPAAWPRGGARWENTGLCLSTCVLNISTGCSLNKKTEGNKTKELKENEFEKK